MSVIPGTVSINKLSRVLVTVTVKESGTPGKEGGGDQERLSCVSERGLRERSNGGEGTSEGWRGKGGREGGREGREGGCERKRERHLGIIGTSITRVHASVKFEHEHNVDTKS